MTTSIEQTNWDTVNDWWSGDFTGDWSQVESPPASGNYIMVRGSDGDDYITPGGAVMDGDFTLDWEVGFPGSAPTGNDSIRMEIFENGGPEKCSLTWNYSDAPLEIAWNHSGSDQDTAQATWSSYGSVNMRIQRVGSTITAYYDIGAGWVALSNPLTWSGDFYIRMNGADDVGLGPVSFEADEGFPYPRKLWRSQFPQQMVGQFQNQY